MLGLFRNPGPSCCLFTIKPASWGALAQPEGETRGHREPRRRLFSRGVDRSAEKAPPFWALSDPVDAPVDARTRPGCTRGSVQKGITQIYFPQSGVARLLFYFFLLSPRESERERETVSAWQRPSQHNHRTWEREDQPPRIPKCSSSLQLNGIPPQKIFPFNLVKNYILETIIHKIYRWHINIIQPGRVTNVEIHPQLWSSIYDTNPSRFDGPIHINFCQEPDRTG